jgi:hypothetical protein
MWNDPYIRDLNPHLQGLLPNESIIIIYQSDPSSPATALFTDALSRMVPEWRDELGNSTTYLGHFPAMDVPGRTIGRTIREYALLNAIIDTKYSFAFHHNPDVVTSRTIKGASIYNAAGNLVPCDPTTIYAAMMDHKDDIKASISLAPGANSWPMVLVNSITIHTREMTDCTKAGGLLDYLYWAQSSTDAADMATAYGCISIMTAVRRIRLSTD